MRVGRLSSVVRVLSVLATDVKATAHVRRAALLEVCNAGMDNVVEMVVTATTAVQVRPIPVARHRRRPTTPQIVRIARRIVLRRVAA